MVNGIERPLDLLNNSKGKEVLVHLKGDKQFVGTLLAFDIHINLVLDNIKEIEKNEVKRNLGLDVFKRRHDHIYFSSFNSSEERMIVDIEMYFIKHKIL